jgi:hypothetical protein
MHRLEVVITNATSGSFQLTAAKSTPEVLNLPDSRTVSGLTVGNPKRYLLNAAPATTVNLSLTAQNGQHGLAAYPSAAFVLVSCQSCSQPSTQTLTHQTPPSAKTVLEVFRNNGSGVSQITLTTSN